MLSNLKIVISTDNSSYSHRLISTLRDMGIKVITLKPDLYKLRASLDEHQPDAVIVDIDNATNINIETLSKYIQSLDKVPQLFALYTYETAELDKIKKLDKIISVEMPTGFAFLCDKIKCLQSACWLSPSDIYLEVRNKLFEVFKLLNVSNNMLGYSYLRNAIHIAICSDDGSLNFSKQVYSELATKYNTTAYCIERAIRTAIKNSWEKTPSNIKALFFDVELLNNPDKPTNSEFILTLSDYIRSEYNDYVNQPKIDLTTH